MPPVVASRPLRWLIAAPLSSAPAGRRLTVSGERFTTVMGALSPKATVEVPDRLGGGATRSFSVAVARPRDFRTREVIGNIELLHDLAAVADRLAKDGDVPGALARLRTLVGDGRLVDTLEGRQPAPPEPTPAPTPAAAPVAPTPAASDDDDDPIFGKAALATPTKETAGQAKSAVGSFISAMRSGAPAPSNTKRAAPGRATAPVVREQVEATARDVLGAPPMAKLECAWRSLRMVMASCPSADDLGVDAVDTDTAGLLEALEAPLSADPWQRPDAVFVVEPVDDVEVLRKLASMAEAARVPIVVEVAAGPVGMPPTTDGLDDTPDPWDGLRSHAPSAWLCATTGAPVLAHETEGGDRVVFGGAAAAVAAMAAASVAQTGVPSNIVGKGGALVAPAAHVAGTGHDKQTIPTRTFVAYATQRALADRGVAALGSETDSDRLRLAAAPMVAGDMSLPGRVLAGRAHRLAVAVRQALGPAASPEELADALEEASGAFLPRIGAGDVTLRVRNSGSEGTTVDASIGASLAGASVTFSSDV
ncbi:MAG: hypothetical protein AAF721_13480 [Myxococcota bacterium]